MADDGSQYSMDDLGKVHILNGRIFDHRTMRVNYATYDLQRDYDIINPRKHANFMTVSPLFDPISHSAADGHPFRYGRILGIYHVDVIYFCPHTHTSLAESMEFLLVHWYRRDITHKAGFKRCRLHRLQLAPPDDPEAFGFLDPDDVIRGCHLIPAFAYGPEEDWTLPSVANEGKRAWKYYYVNWYVIMHFCAVVFHNANGCSSFVDRDMYMRYRGGGVGHVSTQIEDEDAPGGPTDSEDEEINDNTATETSTAATATAPEEEEDEDGTRDDSDDQEAVTDDESSEEEAGDEGEDDGGNGDLEQDNDTDALGAEQLASRLREVIIDDLGYSDL